MAFPAASWLTFVAFSLILYHSSHATEPPQHVLHDGRPKRSNIVFVMTDDQDLHMDSLSYMPHLKKHMADHGTSFNKHYCTVALCCPSRVSLWTGKAAHNTNVTDVNPPYGGYPKFVSQGFNSAYLPLWLQSAGYGTYYVGKLFNAQSVANYAKPHAAGWTQSEFLLDPYTYEYLNATFQRNHDPPVSYEGQYSTDVLAEKAFGFLDDALEEYKSDEKPFFLTIAPTAPHSNVHMNTKIDGNFSEGSNTQSPPIPAERHKHLFERVKVPRTPHFNPANPHGVSWIGKLPKQNKTNVDFNDHFYRSRLRSLQAVDEIVDELFTRLENAGILKETYVFFSTDNGYHIGQHRLQPGKQCPYEEDVNIPFIVRGPGVEKNHSTNIVTTHTDLAPTFLALAGIKLRDDLDGAIIPLHGLERRNSEFLHPDATDSNLGSAHAGLAGTNGWRTEHINIESWGVIMSEGDHGSILYPNHTYKALRITTPGYSLLYTVWCSGEHELYNLIADPYEMDNLYATDHRATIIFLGAVSPPGYWAGAEVETIEYRSETVPEDVPAADDDDTATNQSPNTSVSATFHTKFGARATLEQLIPRLDALMMVLKTCKARTCTHPWEALHPDGDVRSLLDAMKPAYEEFYQTQQKVAFERCEKGYILESEGPVRIKPYSFDVGA